MALRGILGFVETLSRPGFPIGATPTQTFAVALQRGLSLCQVDAAPCGWFKQVASRDSVVSSGSAPPARHSVATLSW